jgi:hypothetical protein
MSAPSKALALNPGNSHMFFNGCRVFRFQIARKFLEHEDQNTHLLKNISRLNIEECTSSMSSAGSGAWRTSGKRNIVVEDHVRYFELLSTADRVDM